MRGQSRRELLAGLAGLSALPGLAAAFPALAADVESVQFGRSVSGRVWSAKTTRLSPAFFVCASPAGGRQEDLAAARLAADCAASGYVAVHLPPTAWRGETSENLEWLPAASDWLRANQASGRLHPRNVFIGGEGLGAHGALSWAPKVREGLQESRLRAVVGINGFYDQSAAERAAGALSQGSSDSTSIVLIGDSEHKASTLDLGHALARSGAAFEMHLLAASGSGADSGYEVADQMKRSLQE
jgi:hypothetical protein